ncbi:uncharacterized protein P884DRAFT_261312 [Thermothelomyces heterothallicus CBS 202.75]|uniref:uncharacterized protein n=1 Tax=Thermothelomyces heterothallicus CBS 202.75 TaxID=1149848 RepID=UPI003743782F
MCIFFSPSLFFLFFSFLFCSFSDPQRDVFPIYVPGPGLKERSRDRNRNEITEEEAPCKRVGQQQERRGRGYETS